MKKSPLLLFNRILISLIVLHVSYADASCDDNQNFAWRDKAHKSCDWIKKSSERRCFYYLAGKNCPTTCRRCCDNDASFTFSDLLDAGTKRDCAWLEGDDKHRARKKYCSENSNVKQNCVKSCHNCPARQVDPHGIKMIYRSENEHSPSSFTENDWFSKWESHNENVRMTKTFETEPGDSRVVLRGKGEVKIDPGDNGELQSIRSPRVYISGASGVLWEDVELTAYGKYIQDVGPGSSSSGLTLVARSSHSLYTNSACHQTIYEGQTCSPCQAIGYYARIYSDPGAGKDEVAFQKEYYHDEEGYTVYTATRRVPYFPDGVLPVNQWVGMKFVVYTIPNTDQVQLELYYDDTDGTDGGNWILIHDSIDDPANPWKASSNKSVPSKCTVQNGDTILGPQHDCILRSDGSIVRWKKASARRISSAKL
jgi:hypothetical protein